MKFAIIAAAEKNMGIGKNGVMPWNLPSDLAHFNKTTRGAGQNAVIMGRVTWESLPAQHKPLKGRINIVITRNDAYELPEGVFKADSVEEALKIAGKCEVEEAFVMGGAQIYFDAIKNPDCESVYLTEIDGHFDCDAFFPKIDSKVFKKTFESEEKTENGNKFRFSKYIKMS